MRTGRGVVGRAVNVKGRRRPAVVAEVSVFSHDLIRLKPGGWTKRELVKFVRHNYESRP